MMKADIGSIRKQATNAKKPEMSIHRNRCEHCDAELRSERPSVREILLNAICLLILLAILAPPGYFAEQWIERNLDCALRHPLWHVWEGIYLPSEERDGISEIARARVSCLYEILRRCL
jgi:hypothetical protein